MFLKFCAPRSQGPRRPAGPNTVRAGSALAVVGLVAFLAGPTIAGEIVEQILVKVNGEIFTKTQLEARQVQVLRGRAQQLSDAELKKQVAAITPDILISVIDEMLLLQRGKELGYRMTDDYFKQVLESIRKENNLEDEAQFQAALKQEGMTMAELRSSLETRAIIDQVQRNEFGRIDVTETEEREYYEGRKGEFTTPATVTLREILIKVPADPKGVNVAADEATKARADALREKLAAGASFEQAVTEVSESPSKANGGLVGPLNLDELAASLRDLLTPLKAGEMTPAIRTQAGYQIIKVESATPPAVADFEQARGQIADIIYNQRRQVEFEKLVKRLRAAAIIEWKNADLQKIYDERLKAIATAGQ